jgi:hypothetical protein
MMAMNWSIFEILAGDLENEMLCVRVDHLGAKRLGQAQRLNAMSPVAGNLDQRKFPFDRPLVAEFGARAP